MANRRKKKPPDETQTEFGLPVEGTNPPPPEDEPEIEVNLPEPEEADTKTSFDAADETDPSPEPVELGEGFEDADGATHTDLHTGPLDAHATDPAAEEVELEGADPPTATSLPSDEPPTETQVPEGATQTEFGLPGPEGPEEPDQPDGPPTMTDVSPEGVQGWKSLAREVDETHSLADDPTRTDLFEQEPDTEDIEDAPGDETVAAGDAPTLDLPGEDHLARTRSLPDDATRSLHDDVPTGDLGLPPPAPGPRFEAVHVEVPTGTFVDTFFERREEDEEDAPADAPRSRRSWRDRLERAKPSPWRDLGLWLARRADPRPWWNRLKARRRRRAGEEPSNQEVARDAARAIASFVASVAKPRAELAAEHNKAWWRRTIVEIAALFLMVVPVELGITGSVGSFGTHPHPYWLIVIPMACARGVVAGLLAAALASTLYAAGAVGALSVDSFAGIFEFQHMVEPILFFVVGFFCGELHDEVASRYRKLERRMEDVQARNQSLRQERDVLRDANRELEKRIVDASVQFNNLIAAAERVESSGRTEVFEIALELVEEHCGAASSVVLLLEDGSLDFLCTRGWPDEEIADRLSATRESRLVRIAIAEGRTVNGFSDEEETPPEGPLVVAPLFDDTGLVRAMLCLDEVPATRLNESTIKTFLGIAEWIGAALTRIAGLERGADPVAAPGTAGGARLGTVEELGERLRTELERCARYGVPASFLATQLTGWTDTTRDGLAAADRFVAEHFTTGLRPSDNIYRFGYPGCYLLVLAGTDVRGAEAVRARLLRRIEYAASQAVGPVEIFATGPDADAPDLLSLAERVASRFRAQAQLPFEGACPIDVPERGEPGTFAELERRLRMEVSLAVRNDFPFAVTAFRTAHRDVATGVTLARHLAEVGARLLRATDGVYLAAEDCTAIVMPNTGGEEAATLAHRLVQALRERDPDAPYGALDTHTAVLGPSHPDVHALLGAIGVGKTTGGFS